MTTRSIIMPLKKKKYKIKRKIKQKKNIKPQIFSFHTTDLEEVERRRIDAKLEKYRVENMHPERNYFSTFLVKSKKDKEHCVEIRSLTDHLNSCDCRDYRQNSLGTCKHIEHVLFWLKKLGAKLYKAASQAGNPITEIFFDSRHNVLRILWSEKTKKDVRDAIDLYFSADGALIGNVVSSFDALCNLFSQNKKIFKKSVRLSRHIDYFMDYQRAVLRKKSAKSVFLADVSAGKKTMDMMKHPLYPYQEEGMMHLAFNERALLADEMGLGKTVQAVAACELLRRYKNVTRVLVIATASLKAEWEEQIAKFTGLSTLIIQGSRKNRLNLYQQHSFFYLTNYEQILMDGPDIQRILSPDVIILDEAQRIKNWQTKTANAVKKLVSPYAFVLTGTPLENRIDDLYSIVEFLDPHLFGPLFRFNRHFYELDEKGRAIGYKNLDVLHHNVLPMMLRRSKHDVEGQLPKRTVNNYFVKMDPEQRLRYEEYKERVARLVHASKRRPLRKEEFEKLQKWLACMRMLCDTPYILDQQCRISPKIDELGTILKELLADPSAKIIIFSEWERMLQLVCELAKQNKWEFAWHTGSVPQHKRRIDINRFKNDADCRLFLSSDSGSLGLNLQVANIVINLDLPWNPAKLEQRIARAWRKHQIRPVQVINLVCSNSIEHRMLGLLAQKQTLAQGVLEGKDNLKEMKLPSGREAFMERMENLMGPIETQTTEIPHPILKTETVPLTEALQTNTHIDLLQSHQNPDTGEKIVFAVVDQPSDGIQKELQHAFSGDAVLLEMMDRQTFELIQRLQKAGVLTLNQPQKILHASAAFTETKKELQKKQIEQAQHYLEKASHKQRMAKVLMAGEFNQEAHPPLREAFELTICAFSALMGEGEKKNKEILTSEFIQEKLIDRHGLPKNAKTLLNTLSDASSEISTQIKECWMMQDSIFQEVEAKVTQCMTE